MNKSKLKLKTGLIFIVGIVGVALILGSCSRYRHGGNYSPEKKGEYMVKHLTEKLELTEAQQRVLNGIKDGMTAMHSSHGADKTAFKDTIIAQLKSDKLDQQVLFDLMEAKHKKMEANMKGMVQTLADFHKILSPEQRTKLVELLEKHGDHHGGEHHGGGHF